MAAVRFKFRNRPTLGSREARAVVVLLQGRGTSRATKLADKILASAQSKAQVLTDLSLRPTEMVELVAALDEYAAGRRLPSDELYRLRAELEAATGRD